CGVLSGGRGGRAPPGGARPPRRAPAGGRPPPTRHFLPGDSEMREWVLAEQNHAGIRSENWEVAVLPFGATEPHNLHMPYGTDNYQVDVLGQRACEWAYRQGAKVLLLPTIPYGVNTNYFKVPGALACSVTPTTLLRLLSDLV